MIIHSFSVAYFALEDRLLLQAKCNTQNQNFWITRRAAIIINQAIQNLLDQIYKKSGIKDELLPFAHSFGQNHAGSAHTPVADQIYRPKSDALVITRIDYGAADAQSGFLVLLNEKGSGQQFQLNTEMLHALSNLLKQQCTEADWGLTMSDQPQNSIQPSASVFVH